jgi:predicted transcriptional regulator
MTAGPPLLTAEQCRCAREVLDWSQFDLAVQADVRIAAVLRFEDGRGAPAVSRIAALQRAFEAAGIEFVPGGARLRERAEAP